MRWSTRRTWNSSRMRAQRELPGRHAVARVGPARTELRPPASAMRRRSPIAMSAVGAPAASARVGSRASESATAWACTASLRTSAPVARMRAHLCGGIGRHPRESCIESTSRARRCAPATHSAAPSTQRRRTRRRGSRRPAGARADLPPPRRTGRLPRWAGSVTITGVRRPASAPAAARSRMPSSRSSTRSASRTASRCARSSAMLSAVTVAQSRGVDIKQKRLFSQAEEALGPESSCECASRYTAPDAPLPGANTTTTHRSPAGERRRAWRRWAGAGRECI